MRYPIYVDNAFRTAKYFFSYLNSEAQTFQKTNRPTFGQDLSKNTMLCLDLLDQTG